MSKFLGGDFHLSFDLSFWVKTSLAGMHVHLEWNYPNLTPAINEFLFFTRFLNRTIFSYPFCIHLTLGLCAPMTWGFFKKPDFLLNFLEKLLNSSFSGLAYLDKDKCLEYR